MFFIGKVLSVAAGRLTVPVFKTSGKIKLVIKPGRFGNIPDAHIAGEQVFSLKESNLNQVGLG